ITGLAIGIVLAMQSRGAMVRFGAEAMLPNMLALTILKEIGPVITALILAGRLGAGIGAEIGSMRVTEQISALSVMGADPIRRLVVPRFLACLLLTPLLTFFCDVFGSLAGWFVAVVLKDVPSSPYWYYIRDAVQTWDLMVGFVKSLAFGGAIGLIACYKGFHCRSGAEGVGRACTESFVTSFIVILVTDFFLGTMFSGLYYGIYGFKSLV
ncbi:MAG: ABC transporter permease, partial [Planctomycetes bacterium]|nr:ABC transporter permease [Planctomycetota bacterium]